MTNEQLQNEINKLSKKALALSKKAFCGNEHSSKYSASMDYCYTRIHQLRAQLTNN